MWSSFGSWTALPATALTLQDTKLHFKVHLTYTDEPIDMPTTEEIELMDQGSDIASAVSPKITPPKWVVSLLRTHHDDNCSLVL